MGQKSQSGFQIGAAVIAAAPPLSNVVEVQGALEAYEPDPLAQYAVKRLSEAIALHKKHVGAAIREQEALEIEHGRHPVPPLDISGMEKGVRKASSALEGLLSLEIDPADLQNLHTEYTGLVPVAEALVKLARRSDDEAVSATAKKLQQALKTLATGEERVAQGGHAGLDAATSKILTKLWAILDEGYDILGILLRNHGIAYDPVYAGRPSTRTVVRVTLTMQDPNAPKGGRPANKAAKAAKEAAKAAAAAAKAEAKAEKAAAKVPTAKPKAAPDAAKGS